MLDVIQPICEISAMTETTEEIDRELEAAQHWAETRAAQLRASACDFLLAQIQRDIAFRL